jgi:hypothetical protein
VELLVVISLITLLASLALPVTMRASAMSRQISCKGNLRQIYMGLQHYQKQWDQFFPGWWRAPDEDPRPDRGDDDLSPLYEGHYVPDLRVFNCPSTTDQAMDRKDPLDPAVDLPMGWDIYYTRSENHPDPYADYPGQLSYEYCGEVEPGLAYYDVNASIAWVAHDNDDGGLQDEFIDDDNHGSSGGNMVFLDGQARWLYPLDWRPTLWKGHNYNGGPTDGEWNRVTGWPERTE